MQVVEAEPSPGAEQKERWKQRLESLQQAVAQLEVDRSELQHHNAQMRTVLERVSNFCGLPPGPSGPASPLLIPVSKTLLLNCSHALGVLAYHTREKSSCDRAGTAHRAPLLPRPESWPASSVLGALPCIPPFALPSPGLSLPMASSSLHSPLHM